MADRYYLPGFHRSDRLRLTGDEARHLARVARKQVGDVVEVFDGEGRGMRAEVVAIDREGVDLVRGEVLPDSRPAWQLTLGVALPKGERVDWLVEKATEIGVSRLVPLRTARSVVDPRGGKLDRLRRVIIEASKQSGRCRLMELAETMEFDAFLRQESAAIRLLAHQGGSEPRSWPGAGVGATLALAVGPEGGWTEAEIATATQEGWVQIGLGPTRLRIETAAVVAAATALALLADPVSEVAQIH